MNSETLNQQTTAFSAASVQFEHTSLPIWNENNNFNSFLSNFPPRPKRKSSSTWPPPCSTQKQDTYEQRAQDEVYVQPACSRLPLIRILHGPPVCKQRKATNKDSPEIAESEENCQTNLETSSLELE